MAKKVASRVGSFRGKVRSNAEKRKRGNSFTYLSVPNGVSVFVPEPDEKYTFDFMPYEVKDKNHPDKDERNEIAVKGSWWYKRPFEVHKDVGAKNERVICPRSFGKPCPICDYKDGLRKEKADENEIKALNTSQRNLYVVIPKGLKKVEEIPHLFDFSDYLFQEKLEQQLGDDERFEDFMHPSEGCSIKITFAEGSFGSNKYAEPTRFDFVDRKEQYDDDFLDTIPCLDECFNIMGYDELKAKFFEVPTDSDEEEEEDEAPKKKSSAAPAKKASVKVADDEDEEEEDEEAPRKPKGKVPEPAAKSRRRPEPEPEPEEEEEEETEEVDTDELIEQIQGCKKVAALMTIATDNEPFASNKKLLKKYSTLTLFELKDAMLEELGYEEPEEEGEEEEEDEPEPPKKKPAASKPTTSGNKCPNGHKYGEDTDEYDDCDGCPAWKACYKAQQAK